MPPSDLATHFFLAAAAILLVCRLVSAIVARLGQPPVVGEMIAGIVLGPSLLGVISPHLESILFPKALLPVIYVAGQLGLVALMFGAGRHLREHLRPGLGRSASAISLIGVAIPLAAGMLLTLAAHGHVGIFLPGVSAGVTAAFTGVTLAITAFPMLARIIVERGLSGTRFGSLALACGAIDDLVAWIMLAGVLSLAAGRLWTVSKAAGGAVLFAVVLAGIVRPALRRYLPGSGLSPSAILLVTMTLLLAAAWFTTSIGLYAVFGAFAIGLVTPAPSQFAPAGDGSIAPAATPAVTKISATSTSLSASAATPAPVDQTGPALEGISRILVPMFFTYSGLNTRFALLDSPRLLLFSAVAVAVAVAGKGGACWLGARLLGEPAPVAGRVAALMNARGLMQLIALNVGLQAHIAGHELFTSLVLVALVTTVLATPLLTWLDRRDQRAERRQFAAQSVPSQAGP